MYLKELIIDMYTKAQISESICKEDLDMKLENALCFHMKKMSVKCKIIRGFLLYDALSELHNILSDQSIVFVHCMEYLENAGYVNTWVQAKQTDKQCHVWKK